MTSKPTDSQELKLGPGWTSLSKSTIHSTTPATSTGSVTSGAVSSSAPRIAYTKAQLLELYEPGSTATIPPEMTKYPGLTSSEPLVPVNIAPDDHIAHVSALVESTEPTPSRSRFQSNPPRAGVEAILGREHAQTSVNHSSSSLPPTDAPSASPPPKKTGHVTASSRDFWSGSAVLAPAERPSTSGGTALERPRLPLKPRSGAPDRASSPNANPPDKSSTQQPYWTRPGRTAADSNSNWRGGSTSVASGGTRYPGSSNDDISASSSGGAADRVAQARKSSDFSGTSTSTRSGFSRDGGLFSRNNKDALKPTNTRDLSALTKGSSRDPSSSSSSLHQDRESRTFNPDNSHRSQYDIMTDQRKLWFYKDPQNVSQGPFTAAQIMEWHKAGYYNEELPVSKHREHGFKALAIAFGLRKEEAPVPAPPPGFVKDAPPPKKEPTGSTTTSSSRSAREDRGRRGGRTVEELAEEVEMMRLQNHRKIQEPMVSSTSDANEPRKEKSFFDTKTPADKELNGHGVLNESKDEHAEKVIEKPKEDLNSPRVNFGEHDQTSGEDPVRLVKTSISVALPPKTTALPKTVERMGPESPPPKQSRLAAFMGRGLIDEDEEQTKIPVVSSPYEDTSAGRTLPEISSALMTETVQQSTNMRPPVQPLTTESIETTGLSDSGLSSPWKSIMTGIQQQQNEPTRTPAGGQTTTEQDLMAIDPAIAHASFARPNPPGSSGVSSSHVVSNSQELPAWLRFSAAPETAPMSHRHEALHDVNHALSAHLLVHTPTVQHNGPQELGVLQDSSMHVQTQPDYQAIERARQAQAQVQAQQMRKLQLQQQIQAQVAAAQRSSAVARAQAQAQAQAQANAQLHAPGQDRGWVLQHQLSQYQHRFELEYRAHVESTRTVQAARSAAANVGVTDPDHQRYLTVAAQAEAVSKQHALAMENIKGAAGRTHSQLLLLAQEQQQQRDFQAQTSQVHSEVFITGTLPSSHVGLPASNPPTISTPMQASASSSVFEVKRTEVAHPMDDHSSVISGDQGDPNHIMQRALPETYDSIVQDDAQGWERVNRKTKPNGTGSALVRNPQSNIQDASLSSDMTRADKLERNVPAVSLSNQSSPNVLKPVVIDAAQAISSEPTDQHQAQSDAAKNERTSEPASAIAPWSKTSAQGSSNGLSLREIQKQEELRSKANEKTVNPPQEKEQVRAAPARWNTLQPWGGAGDPSKQRTMSLREQMRYEEEQRKKNASLPRESTPSSNGPALGTRTGWASLVANTMPPSSRQTTTVVGRKMEDETSFWDSVNSGNQSSALPTRRAPKANSAQQPQALTQQGHSSTGTARQTSSQSNTTSVRRPPSPAKIAKSERRDGSNEVVIGGRISHEFAKWCTDNLQALTGNPNQDTTLVEYLVTIKSPSEIRDTVVQNLGATDKARSFADEFIRRLEFEKPSMVAEAGNGGSTGRKKGRRQRAARVDPSLVLGFTSTSSSSRIMQGTIETPEMK